MTHRWDGGKSSFIAVSYSGESWLIASESCQEGGKGEGDDGVGDDGEGDDGEGDDGEGDDGEGDDGEGEGGEDGKDPDPSLSDPQLFGLPGSLSVIICFGSGSFTLL